MADGHDPATGKFVKGHKKHPAAGRPPNAVNVITKTLREKVLDGFGDVTEFVSELKTAYPPAAAGLLARMMPPGDADENNGGAVVNVSIVSIPPSHFLSGKQIEHLNNTGRLLSAAEAEGPVSELKVEPEIALLIEKAIAKPDDDHDKA